MRLNNYKTTLNEEVNRIKQLIREYAQQTTQPTQQTGGRVNFSLQQVQQRLNQVMPDKNLANLLAPVCLAQIQVESGGRVDIVSKDGYGSVGILQLLPATAQGLGYSPQDRLDPWKNIDMYGKFMTKYHPQTQEQAARMWNGGPGGANKPATLKYWQRVQQVMAQQGNNPNITLSQSNSTYNTSQTTNSGNSNNLYSYFFK